MEAAVDRYRTCLECGIVDGNITRDYLQQKLDQVHLSAGELMEKFPDELPMPFQEVAMRAMCPRCDHSWSFIITKET